jgi:hypothetical protein
MDTGGVTLTQVCIYVAGDWLVPRTIEVVEDDTWVRDLDVSLDVCVSMGQRPEREVTYSNMVIQIVPNRQVDPLIR